MVVEGIHVEDIFELVSLVLSLIISWTFRILAHEEDQYTDFLSLALKKKIKPGLGVRELLFWFLFGFNSGVCLALSGVPLSVVVFSSIMFLFLSPSSGFAPPDLLSHTFVFLSVCL